MELKYSSNECWLDLTQAVRRELDSEKQSRPLIKDQFQNEMTRGQRANKAKMKQRTDDEETYTITHIVGSVVDIIDDGKIMSSSLNSAEWWKKILSGKQKSEARLGETVCKWAAILITCIDGIIFCSKAGNHWTRLVNRSPESLLRLKWWARRKIARLK